MSKHYVKILRKSIFLSICIILLTVFAFISIKKFYNNREIDHEEFVRNKVLDRLNIIIPDNCELLYHCNSDSGFSPGGETYYFVFSFTDDPIIFLEEYEFQSDEKDKFRKTATKLFSDSGVAHDWDVPSKYRPQFNYDYNYIIPKNSC